MSAITRMWLRGLAAGVFLMAAINGIVIVGGTNAPGPGGGQEAVQAARWAARDWNERNPHSAHPIEIVPFWDDNDPRKAVTVANQIVADGRFMGVVGHQISATSQAAGPVYAQAQLPAITAEATEDEITADNEWYFRTVFDNSGQGRGIAAYLSSVMDSDRAISSRRTAPTVGRCAADSSGPSRARGPCKRISW